jgi:hypothetical protein
VHRLAPAALCILITLIAGCGGSSAVPPAPASGDSLQVRTVADDLALTLTVPHSTYPRYALARVMLAARNLSHHVIVIAGRDDGRCGGDFMRADATTASGAPRESLMLSPVPLIIGGLSPCPPYRLRPGKALAEQQYFVVQAPGITGSVTLPDNLTIQTRPAVVRLTPGSVHAISASPDPPVRAAIPQPSSTAGPFAFAGWSSCVERGVRYSEIDPGWATSGDGVATPEFPGRNCHKIVEWHAFAGYVGYPVVRIDYQST